MDEDDTSDTTQREILKWNNDPAWVQFVEALRPFILAIASKYTIDLALREDAVQNAVWELLLQYPEEVRGFEDYSLGNITEGRWQEVLRSYCLTLARNEILSTLSSHTTGNLYTGRTHMVKTSGPTGKGARQKIHTPARYVSLEQLVDESGLQVSEQGDLSWNSLYELNNADNS